MQSYSSCTSSATPIGSHSLSRCRGPFSVTSVPDRIAPGCHPRTAAITHPHLDPNETAQVRQPGSSGSTSRTARRRRQWWPSASSPGCVASRSGLVAGDGKTVTPGERGRLCTVTQPELAQGAEPTSWHAPCTPTSPPGPPPTRGTYRSTSAAAPVTEMQSRTVPRRSQKHRGDTPGVLRPALVPRAHPDRPTFSHQTAGLERHRHRRGLPQRSYARFSVKNGDRGDT